MRASCARLPPNPICSELPGVLNDLIEGAAQCGRLRARLALVETLSAEPDPDDLQSLLRDARTAMDARCPP